MGGGLVSRIAPEWSTMKTTSSTQFPGLRDTVAVAVAVTTVVVVLIGPGGVTVVVVDGVVVVTTAVEVVVVVIAVVETGCIVLGQPTVRAFMT
jgi:hypothetical protein